MLLEKTRYSSIIAKLTDDDFKKLADATESAESARPFATGDIYALLFVYRAIIGRIIFGLMDGAKKGKLMPWPLDPVVHQHLKVGLSEEEFSQFEKRKFAHYSWVLSVLQSKFLEAAHRLVIGEESAKAALKQSRKAIDEVNEAEARQTREKEGV
jgi:hypothetical protein